MRSKYSGVIIPPMKEVQGGIYESLCQSVCPSIRLSVCKLFTFSSSSQESHGHFQPNFAQSILWLRGFQTLFQVDIILK